MNFYIIFIGKIFVLSETVLMDNLWFSKFIGKDMFKFLSHIYDLYLSVKKYSLRSLAVTRMSSELWL